MIDVAFVALVVVAHQKHVKIWQPYIYLFGKPSVVDDQVIEVTKLYR
jgi:hypothetical protein